MKRSLTFAAGVPFGLAARPFLALCLLAVSGGPSRAAEDENGATPVVTRPAIAAAGTRHAIILCGHPGDEPHREAFAETVTRLHQGLVSGVGCDPARITLFFGVDAEQDDKSLLPVPATGPAAREAVTAAVAALRTELQPEDSLWVIVMGHAHFDGRHSWLNLPGPDMHQDDFGRLFKDLTCREQVFVIATPASGYYLKPLAAPGRVVITATEADLELNETLFAQSLADALHPTADRPLPDADQDGTLSVFDLYVATTKGVAQRYVAESLLITEHALLDDNADGRGTELQRDYLTEAEGGRLRAGFKPMHKTGQDGALSATIRLALAPGAPSTAPQKAETAVDSSATPAP